MYVRLQMHVRQERNRHRLHARPAQSARDSRGVLRQKGSPQQRELHREAAQSRGHMETAQSRVHMETVRETEEITEICPTVR